VPGPDFKKEKIQRCGAARCGMFRGMSTNRTTLFALGCSALALLAAGAAFPQSGPQLSMQELFPIERQGREPVPADTIKPVREQPWGTAPPSAPQEIAQNRASIPGARSDLIGKWCSAYGSGWKKGDGPLDWARCTRSNLRALLEAEGYAYMLEITDKTVTINRRRCELIEASKQDKGYALSLKCPGGKETWRVSLSGKKSDPTLTTPGEVLFDGALSGLGYVASLPKGDPMIREWCPVKSKWQTESRSYTPGRCNTDEDVGLKIEQGSYSGHEFNCDFSDVKRLPSGDGYLVATECGGTGAYWNEKVEFRLVGKIMTQRVLSHTESVPEKSEDCTAVVSNLPVEKDGSSFLNIRSGPGTEFNVKLKLDPGEKLKIDAEYQGWKRVTTTLHDMDISGWVRDKYITETCEKTRASSDDPPKPEPKTEPADDPKLADWCRRNDPSSSTQSCANLRSSPVKGYPNWLFHDPPAVKALRP
jgi:hypothetical protein